MEELASRCGKVAEQIDRRVRGRQITDRLVSLSDPDARPIRKGKLGKPTEFGYVEQICEITENTRGRPRVHPPGRSGAGNPAENTLLPHTAAELERAGTVRGRSCRRRVPARTDHRRVPRIGPTTIHIAGRHEPGSRRTRKRRARYRTGIEGRISHLKRGYGLRRSRLKGRDGTRIWTGWAILAYDLDTFAIRTR